MIGFTKEERIVLVFLVACFLVGAGVDFVKKTPEAIINHEIPGVDKEEISDNSKTNINTATFGELIKIKGIGVKTADRIMDYREQNGPFFCKEDIMKIKGIGKKKFDLIRESIIAE